MTINTKYCKSEIISGLTNELVARGFKRRGTDFYRKTSTGKDLLNVTFTSYHGVALKVKIIIGVRHDAVEDLVHLFTEMPEDLKKWAYTIGGDIRYLFGYEDIWLIESEEDIAPVLSAIVSLIDDVFMLFYLRFSSLEETFKVISKDDAEADRFRLWPPARAMGAVAAAFVLGDRQVFDDVVQKKIEYLNNMKRPNFVLDQQVPQFIALIDYLKQQWDKRE